MFTNKTKTFPNYIEGLFGDVSTEAGNEAPELLKPGNKISIFTTFISRQF